MERYLTVISILLSIIAIVFYFAGIAGNAVGILTLAAVLLLGIGVLRGK